MPGEQLASASRESGRITATVDVFTADPGRRDDPNAPVKVRGTVWSGPDFRTPTISRGAICDEPAVARDYARRFIEACELLGIPVYHGLDDHLPVEPILPPRPREFEEWQRR